ncbi:hypothetical protein [Effusibacillus consociatus]|uniref:Uncharacterized protein n=1 Tax=Effusibacillus consociatus TaxID=1117041 RepID=A0ABV9Q384_9BACL
MWKYVSIALVSGLILYLVNSTGRIYHELLSELLPQVAEENRHNIQYDMIHSLVENRTLRLTMVLPVAFLCTFILLPYDLAKGWHWIELKIVRFLQK